MLPKLPVPVPVPEFAPSAASHSGRGVGHVVAMAVVVCVVAPSAVWLMRRAKLGSPLDRTPWPLALFGFMLFHDFTMGWMVTTNPSGAVDFAAHLLLGLAAVQFWAPVIGGRLTAGPRVVYLFAASMGLDLTAVYLIANGYSLAGVSLVMLMLPIPFAGAIALAGWAVSEEAAQRAVETDPETARSSPTTTRPRQVAGPSGPCPGPLNRR